MQYEEEKSHPPGSSNTFLMDILGLYLGHLMARVHHFLIFPPSTGKIIFNSSLIIKNNNQSFMIHFCFQAINSKMKLKFKDIIQFQ